MEFKDILHEIRLERGLSQQQLSDMIFVERSTVSSWETGRRVPDLATISKISSILNIDVAAVMNGNVPLEQKILLVDDENIILEGCRPVLQDAFPLADIVCFRKSSDAVEYALKNHVSYAFLDIQLGSSDNGGIDLCRKLRAIEPSTRVVFLTSYPDYALTAWGTGASAFLVKPLSSEALQECIARVNSLSSNGV